MNLSAQIMKTATDSEKAIHGHWLIWSMEHRAYWGPGHNGYVGSRAEAGRYPFGEALEIVRDGNIYSPLQFPNEAMIADS